MTVPAFPALPAPATLVFLPLDQSLHSDLTVVLGSKRHTKEGKKSHFIYKHGLRHHSFDPEKAPYPLCYDREVLEMESLDNRLIHYLRNGSVSFIDFASASSNDSSSTAASSIDKQPQPQPPERVLDLGCGTGTWIIDAAEEWPDCEFVSRIALFSAI